MCKSLLCGSVGSEKSLCGIHWYRRFKHYTLLVFKRKLQTKLKFLLIFLSIVHSYTQPQYAALNGRTPSSSIAAPRYVQGYQGYQTRPVYGTSTVRSCSTMGCRYSCGSTSNGGMSCTCPPGYMLASHRLNCIGKDYFIFL